MSYANLSLSKNISPTMGDQVGLRVNHSKHFVNMDATVESSISPDIGIPKSDSQFYNNLMDTFTSLNQEIVASDKITEEFMIAPEKVNVHDVMIALQKSKLSLDLTRSVIQKAIDGYNTIINLR